MKSQPYPLPNFELQRSMLIVIVVLIMLLGLQQPFRNFTEEGVTVSYVRSIAYTLADPGS